MNDDALLPDHELASAYLDGDLSEAERAQVESTPRLAALVAAFNQVRAEVADVSAPNSEDREAALAASLSQYDTLFSTTSSPSAEEPSANVVPLARQRTGRPTARRRWTRPLLVAAASLILLGVAGVTVLNKTDDSTDDQSATMSTASKDIAASGEAESAPADVSLSTIGSINGPASAVTQILNGDQLLEFAYQYAPVAADDGGAGTDTIPAAKSTAAEATEMTTSACPLGENQVIIADIIWIDTLAVAVRDMVTGEVQAIDAQCRVLVSVTP